MAFFNIRQWLDRISEHPNRRTLTNVEDPTDVKTYDLSRAEGEVSVQGTASTAATFNDLEGRIASAFTAVEQAMPEANPAAEATVSLIRIKINGTVYEIEGGGGTTIEKITKAQWDAMTAEERAAFIGVVEDTNADYVPLTADNIPYDSENSIAEKVEKLTVKLTLAEYNALTEKAPNTRYIITDAPALEYTAEDLSYDGGTTTTKQKIEALLSADFTFTPASGVTASSVTACKNDKLCIFSAEIRFTGNANAWTVLGNVDAHPAVSHVLSAGINTSNGTYLGMVEVRQDGTVRIYPTSNVSNGYVMFSLNFKTT
jgi:hypothetical protein